MRAPTTELADVDLFDPRTYLHGPPHAGFATLRRAAPVAWQEERAMLGWPAGTGYWAVTRYTDITHVNRHPQLFSSQLGRPRSVTRSPTTLPSSSG